MNDLRTLTYDHHLSPIENWALRVRNKSPLAGAFPFEEKVNVMEAWDAVGGRRYGVTKRPAEALMSDDTVLRMPDKHFLFPTWDGKEYVVFRENTSILKFGINVVSSRFETVDPQDAITTLFEHMRDYDGNPLPVTAIVATEDLSELIVQWQTDTFRVGGDLVSRFVAARIGIVGSIMGSFYDFRTLCLNKLPILIANTSFKIIHRFGANDSLDPRFGNLMRIMRVSQALQQETYNILLQIPLRDEDIPRILIAMYPYEELPDGYSQNTTNHEIQTMVNQGKIPHRNARLMENRKLARYGIEQAISENGRKTLWEGVQANFGAAHRPTRSYAAAAVNLAFQGGDRRDEAIRAFREVLLIASDRGHRDLFPAAMQEIMLSRQGLMHIREDQANLHENVTALNSGLVAVL